jgi:hypothetical protein
VCIKWELCGSGHGAQEQQPVGEQPPHLSTQVTDGHALAMLVTGRIIIPQTSPPSVSLPLTLRPLILLHRIPTESLLLSLVLVRMSRGSRGRGCSCDGDRGTELVLPRRCICEEGGGGIDCLGVSTLVEETLLRREAVGGVFRVAEAGVRICRSGSWRGLGGGLCSIGEGVEEEDATERPGVLSTGRDK